MSDIPGGLMYTESHEWVRLEQDGTATVGITDYAQAALGELVYVELPEMDSELGAGDDCAVIESVKAASDIYSPVDGVVCAVNDVLADQPELINEQPYDDGWIMRLANIKKEDVEDLMDADDYQARLEDEEEEDQD